MKMQRSTRLEFETLEDRVTPATLTWTGAVDGLWSNAGNWATTDPTHTVPQNGDAIVLPAGAANRTQVDGLNSDSFASITIQDTGYHLSGVDFVLSGGITVTSSSGGGIVEIENNIILLGAGISLGDAVNLKCTGTMIVEQQANVSVQGPSSAVLSIFGSLTVTALANLDIQTNLDVLGVLSNSAATVRVEPSGYVAVEPGAVLSTSGNVAVSGNGTQDFTVHGTVYVIFGGEIDLGQDAVFSIQIDGSVYVAGAFADVDGTIDNDGLIVVENNGPAFVLEDHNAVLINRGTLYSAGLTESIFGQIYNYGTITVAPGGSDGEGLYLYYSVLGNAGSIYAYGTLAISTSSALYDYNTLVLEPSGYLYNADLVVIEQGGVFYDYGTFANFGTYYNFGQQIGSGG
jgi:hypothetical protein